MAGHDRRARAVEAVAALPVADRGALAPAELVDLVLAAIEPDPRDAVVDAARDLARRPSNDARQRLLLTLRGMDRAPAT